MAPDPLQTVLNILSTDWNSANTDSITPNFIKVTDIKRLPFGEHQDWVLAQRSIENNKPAGTGQANKHESNKFNLDVRVIGQDQEDHFLNVLEEIKRIIQAKKVNPSADYLILEFDGDTQDLSDKTHSLWRKIMPVQLNRYNVNR